MSTDINIALSARMKPAHLVGLFLVAFAVLCTRRLDQILIPQFYAEDGTQFFAQAFSAPISSIFQPVATYLNLVPRVVASVLSPLPWSVMPLLYSVSAAAITAFVAMRFLVAKLPVGAAIAGYVAVLAVPSTGEPFLNLCCLHFVLSLLIVIPFFEPIPSKISCVGAVLGALSGPEVVVMLPLVAIATVFIHRTPVHRKLAMVVAGCAVIQIAIMLSVPRASMAQVWPPLELVRLYSESLFAHSLDLSPTGGWIVAGLVAVALVVLLVRNHYLLPAALLLATMVGFLMAARSVNVGWPNPLGNGARYTFAPLVLFVFAIGWLASCPSRYHWRWVPAGLLLLALVSTSASEWVGRVPPNYRWSEQVAEARNGERVVFQIPGPVMWEFPVPVR